MDEHLRQTNAAATGQVGTEAGFLDAHFEACRQEYEAMLGSVGVQRGWSVLDAACGGGSYLPLLAESVGPRGRIAAFDLAADSVERVQRLAAAGAFGCPVEARVASLTSLPYPDGAFDAVWCANSLQYLPDEEFTIALAEFRRVVRPGGLVAIKDPDPGLWLFAPGDPGLLLRTWVALAPVAAPLHGTLRAHDAAVARTARADRRLAACDAERALGAVGAHPAPVHRAPTDAAGRPRRAGRSAAGRPRVLAPPTGPGGRRRLGQRPGLLLVRGALRGGRAGPVSRSVGGATASSPRSLGASARSRGGTDLDPK
jgi:ubiquinone/menaquinone biosynthesis C-methylase UbiE